METRMFTWADVAAAAYQSVVNNSRATPMEEGGLEAWDNDLVGCVAQLICARASVFVGSIASSFSWHIAYLHRTELLRMPVERRGPGERGLDWLGA